MMRWWAVISRRMSVQRGFKILRLFQLVGKRAEAVGRDGVEHGVRASAMLKE